ncbi:MAG: hypothetical protein RR744_00380 [Cellulosilyticaceae bacterium]
MGDVLFRSITRGFITEQEKIDEINENFIKPRGQDSKKAVAERIRLMLANRTCSGISCRDCPMTNRYSKTKRWRNSDGCYTQIGFDFTYGKNIENTQEYSDMINGFIEWANGGFVGKFEGKKVGFDF